MGCSQLQAAFVAQDSAIDFACIFALVTKRNRHKTQLKLCVADESENTNSHLFTANKIEKTEDSNESLQRRQYWKHKIDPTKNRDRLEFYNRSKLDTLRKKIMAIGS